MSTIDPGVDNTLDNVERDVEKGRGSDSGADLDPDQAIDEQQEDQEEKHFLDPSRWWFASTASPLIAGTFGPMASAFNICALVAHWRVYSPPGTIVGANWGQPVPDPRWLIGINAVSLVCAVTANLSLLLNMARRVSFAVAQPITVIGFYLASFILIALVAVASTPIFRITPTSTHALGQAYYYAIFAAVLYGFIAVLMSITVWGAYAGHYSKEFQLTMSQRTLMLQTISFMFYLLIGALVFSTLEGWQYLDAVYFCNYTLLTIGLGDYYVPKTHGGRSFLIPYAVGGIVTLGLVISSIRTMVLESGGQKLGARMTEKKREAVLASANFEKGKYKISMFATRHFNPDKELPETHKRQQQFHAMRQIIQRAERKRRYMSLTISLGVTCALWFGGAAIYQATENMTYFSALYFTYTSLLTIGYGDISPKSENGRPFFVFWSLLAVPALTVLISDLGDTVVKGIADATNWIGTVTILPGEQGLRASMKKDLKKLFGTTPSENDGNNFDTKQPGNFLPSKFRGKKRHKLHYGEVNDVLMDRLEEKDMDAVQRAAQEHPHEQVDQQFYTYLLLRESRRLLLHLDASPPKQYSYDEWAYYLRLLGLDENDAEQHSEPHVKPDRQDGDYKTYIDLAKDIDQCRKIPPWSWLGAMSPLMTDKSEAEWILHRLLIRLQQQLRIVDRQRLETPISVTQSRPMRGNDDVDGKASSSASLSGSQHGSSSSGRAKKD